MIFHWPRLCGLNSHKFPFFENYDNILEKKNKIIFNRDDIELEYKPKNNFEKYILSRIWKEIPRYCLEYFDEIHKLDIQI